MSSLQPDINCLVCFSPISSKSTGSDQFQEDSFDLLQNSLDIPHLGSILKFSLCCQKCIYNLVEMVDTLKGIEELQRKLLQLKDKFKSQLLKGHSKCIQDPLGSAEAEGNGIVDIFAEDRAKLIHSFLTHSGSQHGSHQSFTSPAPPCLANFELKEVPESEIGIPETPDVIPGEISDQDQRIFQSFQAKSGINLKECKVTLNRIDSPNAKRPSNVKRSRGDRRKKLSHIQKNRKDPGNSSPKSNHSVFSEVIKKEVEEKTSEITVIDYRLCRHCGEELTTSMGLHMKNVHPEIPYDGPPKPWKCTICKASFRSKVILNTHERLHNKKTYNCSICFKGVRNLTSHMKNFHPDGGADSDESGEYIIKCKLCSFTTEYQRDIARHVKEVHPGSKPYVCKYCQASYEVGTSLSRHVMAMHNPKNKFKCKICPQRFDTKNKLTRHLNSHTQPPKERTKCPQCDRTFLIPRYLEAHIKIAHEGEGRLICEICGKIFYYKSFDTTKFRYKEHMKSEHEGIDLRKHKCPECPKSYRHRIPLERHIQATHRGGIEKNFSCEKCGKRYPILKALEEHLNTHEGIRPYECKTCHKRSYTQCALRKHEKIHEELRPYKCKTCPREFYKQTDLNSHEKVHEISGTFPCPYCDKVYPLKTYLWAHLYRTTTECSAKARKEAEGKGLKLKEYVKRSKKKEMK